MAKPTCENSALVNLEGSLEIHIFIKFPSFSPSSTVQPGLGNTVVCAVTLKSLSPKRNIHLLRRTFQHVIDQIQPN